MRKLTCKPIYRYVAILAILVFLCAPATSWAAPQGQAGAEPEIDARAAIVVEYPSGRILYQKSMHDKLAPASTTKILTAILAIEHGNLDQVVTAAPEDLVGESSMGLQAGEQQTMHNLLYGMLLPSGNDAAMTIARTIGSQEGGPGADGVDKFVSMMNARIAQLGLTDSHFVNPHGLDTPNHYSSAYDLASFTWYALHLPVFAEIVKQQFYQAPGHPLKNTNEMLSRYAGTDGVKTGWTDAGGLCLVTSATRDGHRLISVVLNAPHWYTDSAAILDYGFARLAAAPSDPSAEVLSVASRGAAGFVLASATSTPPLEAAPQKQGGGAAAAAAPGGLVAQTQQRAAGLDAPAPQAQTANLVQAASVVSSTPRVSLGSAVWAAPVLALLVFALAGWLLLRRRSTMAFASALPAPAIQSPPVTVRQAMAAQAPRTLGSVPPPRRREPNLLLSQEEIAQGHVQNAVGLAIEGRQGSAMAEFLLAIRSGAELDAASLDARYGLSQAGFLALAGAQDAAGRRQDAIVTLEFALAALPFDRLLRLSLRQMRGR